jgi:N-acetylmuramoyl-L-alanine amidase
MPSQRKIVLFKLRLRVKAMLNIRDNKPLQKMHKRILYISLVALVFTLGSAYRISDNEETTEKKFIVVLDAGHGGSDPGTLGTGRYKTAEKDIALAVTLKVGKLIEANYPNVKVVYTRTGDTFPTLKRRVEIANSNNADLFISVHCNANPNTEASGSESFVMGLHKSEESLRNAMRENASIYLESNGGRDYDGFDPNNPDTYIALSLRENIYQDKSILMAKNVQDEFVKLGRKNRGVKQAPYYVITFTNMPSILIELGFLSNHKEEDYLQSKEAQEELSSAVYRAFIDYQSKLFNIQPLNTPQTTVRVEKAEKANAYEGLIWEEIPLNEVAFKVQIMSSATPLQKKSNQFKGLERIEEYLSNGAHKYLVGSTRSLDDAKKNQKILRDAGFSGAFVVAFENGIRISNEEALKKIQK